MEKELKEGYQELNQDGRRELMEYLRYLLTQERYCRRYTLEDKTDKIITAKFNP